MARETRSDARVASEGPRPTKKKTVLECSRVKPARMRVWHPRAHALREHRDREVSPTGNPTNYETPSGSFGIIPNVPGQNRYHKEKGGSTAFAKSNPNTQIIAVNVRFSLLIARAQEKSWDEGCG